MDAAPLRSGLDAINHFTQDVRWGSFPPDDMWLKFDGDTATNPWRQPEPFAGPPVREELFYFDGRTSRLSSGALIIEGMDNFETVKDYLRSQHGEPNSSNPKMKSAGWDWTNPLFNIDVRVNESFATVVFNYSVGE